MKRWLFFCLLANVLLAATGIGKASASEAANRVMHGKTLYEQWCLPCHDAGPGYTATMAIAQRLGESRSVLLNRGDLTQEYVEYVVRNGFQMMPPFRPTEISDRNVDDIWRYMASMRAKDRSGKSKEK